VYTGFWWGNLREKNHFEETSVNGRGENKMDIQEVRCGSLDWTDMAQDRDRCRALVNGVMKLWVP